MGQAFDLKKYLEQARSEGVTDSEGTFTVAREKALTKLARFALPDDYDWVLKIVQAANAWKCPRLIARQTRVATSFFFCPPREFFPSDSDIVTSLQQGTYDRGGPVDTLCMALRSLVDQVELSFVLASRRGSETGKPIFAGDDTTALDEKTREAWTSMKRTGLRLTVSHFTGKESFTGRYIPTFSSVERRDLKIAQVLVQKSYASVTEVSLDGMVVSNPCQHPRLGRGTIWRPCTFGALADEFDTKVETFLLDPRDRLSRLVVPAGVKQHGASYFYLRSLDWLALTYGMENVCCAPPNHEVCWIRHGAVVKRLFVPNSTLATTLTLYLDSAHLRSDIAGLSVHIDRGERQRAEAEFRLVTERLQSLPSHIANVLRDDDTPTETECTEDSELELTAAGYSVFTASLRFNMEEWGRTASEFMESLRRLALTGRLDARWKKWCLFLEADLKRLVFDSRRELRE